MGQNEESFVSAATRYVREYAKIVDPWDENCARHFSGLGYGHADNILEAKHKREKYICDIKESSKGLSPEDLEQAKRVTLRDFKYDREFEVPASVGDNGPIEYKIVKNFYDPANVEELLNEVVQIALGNENATKSVAERFEKSEPHVPSNRDIYNAMLRGEHFDI